MKKLGKKEFSTLTTNSEIIEADWFGPKVVLLADGSYLKLFRVKRALTSARLYPYSKRFIHNADKLKQLDIPTIDVLEEYKIKHLRRASVHYSPLEGQTLRSQAISFDEELAEKLGAFIGKLHEQGIYFRSLHMGNIVLTPTGDLGLIDIADMKFYGKPLNKQQRIRNLKHLSRYKDDLAALSRFSENFAKNYAETAADLKENEVMKLITN